ncbi:MAG: sodium pump decarboxylase subunit gamma [Treponema sp.]|nr:sodium pump decarboxylase subunit gamma [Treponema sp.]
MTLTLMEMLVQGNYLQIGIMGFIIIFWVIMLSILAKGVEAKFAAAEKKEPAVLAGAVKSADGAVTAAITAAVTEYRKTNK